MIEPSLRTLPPPTPSRDIYGHSHYNQNQFQRTTTSNNSLTNLLNRSLPPPAPPPPASLDHYHHQSHQQQQHQNQSHYSHQRIHHESAAAPPTPPTPPETLLEHPNTGHCLVILPYSRSAFRGTYFSASQGPNKCECSSFFMNPGDPELCLCGHPAAYHSPTPQGEDGSGDTGRRAREDEEPEEYVPPIAAFAREYAAKKAAEEAKPSSSSSSSTSQPQQQHQQNTPPQYYNPHPPHHSRHSPPPPIPKDPWTDIPSILTRLTHLEQQLSTERQSRLLLEENYRHLHLAYTRLSQHTRLLSQELDLIIAKSGESAREALDIEVLTQRQRKMQEDIERITQAVEGLDERTEDLEFCTEDFERWMVEEEARRTGNGNGNGNGAECAIGRRGSAGGSVLTGGGHGAVSDGRRVKRENGNVGGLKVKLEEEGRRSKPGLSLTPFPPSSSTKDLSFSAPVTAIATSSTPSLSTAASCNVSVKRRRSNSDGGTVVAQLASPPLPSPPLSRGGSDAPAHIVYKRPRAA